MQCGRLPNRPLAIATGPTLAVMPERSRAAQEDLAVAADRVRAVRVAVRVAPRPVLAGDRQLVLDVARSRAAGRRSAIGQSAPTPSWRRGVGSRSGGTAACSRRSAPSTRRRRGRSCWSRAAPGRRRRSPAARSSTGGASRPRRSPSPRPGPRTGPASRATTFQPGAGQPLQQGRAAGAAADDDQVDLVGVVEPPHVRRAAGAWSRVPSLRQQPGRLVAARGRPAHPAGSRLGRQRVDRPGCGVADLERLAACRSRCSCSRAGRRGRRSRSRSRPTGASRTRCRRSASTGSTRAAAIRPCQSLGRQVLDAPGSVAVCWSAGAGRERRSRSASSASASR